MRLLLEAGANPNARGDIGMTPLMAAGKEGHSGIVHMLVESGADVNEADMYGRTTLIWAVMSNSLDTFRCIIEAVANVDHQTLTGDTGIDVCGKIGKYEAAAFLLLSGAERNLKNNDGQTVLELDYRRQVGITQALPVARGSSE